MRLVHKFGPGTFGELPFGGWPDDAAAESTDVDGPAMPPTPEPDRGWWRSRGRVRLRSRSVLAHRSSIRSVAVIDPRVAPVWHMAASGLDARPRTRARSEAPNTRVRRTVSEARQRPNRAAHASGLVASTVARMAARSRTASDQFVHKRTMAAAVASAIVAMAAD